MSEQDEQSQSQQGHEDAEPPAGHPNDPTSTRVEQPDADPDEETVREATDERLGRGEQGQQQVEQQRQARAQRQQET